MECGIFGSAILLVLRARFDQHACICVGFLHFLQFIWEGRLWPDVT